MKKILLLTVVSFAMATNCFAKEPSFQGLGDLPGGDFVMDGSETNATYL